MFRNPEEKLAFDNLCDYSDTLNELGIIHWLDGGTLLGAYRDQAFCEDDHNDVDIFTWGNYSYLIPEIVRINKAKGFEIYNLWKGDLKAKDKGQELAMGRYDLKVDLGFWEKKGNEAWTCVYEKPKDADGYSPCTPQVTLAKFYEELMPFEFNGRTFNIPRNIEGYLTQRYGNWKVKKHRSQYCWYDPKDNAMIKPDYEFDK